jgi:hypothetical protein
MIIHTPAQRAGRFSIAKLQGLTGDHLAVALARHLDDGYHYVRRVAAGGIAPIDAVVVGPGGTWALTRVELRGRFRKRNGHWYAWSRSTESWIPWDARPVTEARMAGHRLELYLERATLPAVVEPCLVVLRTGEVGWDPDQRPGIHVHSKLDKLARRITRDEVLTPAQVDRIVALLDPRQPLPRLAPSTPHG